MNLVRCCCCYKRRVNYEDLSDRQRMRGLLNLGNASYFNSAIQCLVETQMMLKDIAETTTNGKLTNEFRRFLAHFDPENRSISTQVDPGQLIGAFQAKVPRFCGSKQHDCHQFLRNFLDQLRQEERFMNPSNKLTAVDKVFGGHFMTIYICKECDTPYHVCEPFLDISVSINRHCESKLKISKHRQRENTEIEFITPYQGVAASIMKRLSPMSADLPAQILFITDCLQYFTRQEVLDKQYLCKSCTNDASSSNPHENLTSATCTKQTLILNPPAVLVLHLKRFEKKGLGFKKANHRIAFEEVLNLGPYCSSWCQRNEDREQNIWYSLYAVVVHSGSLTSGHYVAYVKDRNENIDIGKFLQEEYLDKDMTVDQLVEMMKKLNQRETVTTSKKYTCRSIASPGNWYCLDDSSVSRVSVDEVLKKEAYLLFYSRVPPIECHTEV